MSRFSYQQIFLKSQKDYWLFIGDRWRHIQITEPHSANTAAAAVATTPKAAKAATDAAYIFA